MDPPEPAAAASADRWRYHDLCHRDHRFWNPLEEAQLVALSDLLSLGPRHRILDVACGPGLVLDRLLGATGASAVGVDLSPSCIAAAAKRLAPHVAAGRVDLLCDDGKAALTRLQGQFDAALCLGADWIFGGVGGTAAALRSVTKAGGLVVVGTTAWLRPAPSDYRDLTRCTEEEATRTLADHHRAVADAGLSLVTVMPSSQEAFDHYERLRWSALARHLQQMPDDPRGGEFRQRMAKERDRYLKFEQG